MRTIWLLIIGSGRSFQNTNAMSIAQVCPSDATCKWTFDTGVAEEAANVGVSGHGEIVSAGELTGHKVATRIHCAGRAGTGRGGGLVYGRVRGLGDKVSGGAKRLAYGPSPHQTGQRKKQSGGL